MLLFCQTICLYIQNFDLLVALYFKFWLTDAHVSSLHNFIFTYIIYFQSTKHNYASRKVNRQRCCRRRYTNIVLNWTVWIFICLRMWFYICKYTKYVSKYIYLCMFWPNYCCCSLRLHFFTLAMYVLCFFYYWLTFFLVYLFSVFYLQLPVVSFSTSLFWLIRISPNKCWRQFGVI